MKKEPSLYSVVVGNVGTVYAGDDVRLAHSTYWEYMRISQQPTGRASGEDVTMFMDGDIVREYIGTLSQDEFSCCEECAE
jgi:hypothetical protein